MGAPTRPRPPDGHRPAATRPAPGAAGPPRRRKRVRRTMSADGAWKGTMLAIAVFAVLASGGMVDSAEGMPLGWQRTIALGVARSVDRVANLLSLNRPYDWASDELGRTQADQDFEFPASTTTSPTTTTLPALRVPTAGQPLKVVMAGDSTAIGVGDRLKVAVGDDPTLDVDVEGKVATGLTRSDYFNWGARTKELVDTLDPDVMLFMVGANDSQSILQPDGEVVARYGTPQWADEYRRRVAGIMDLVHDGPRRMLWVGQPHVGDPDVQRTVALVNSIIEEEAAARPWVSYFDMASVVGGTGGSFSEYVTFEDGKTVKCYASDGVHLSLQCLDRSMTKLVPAVHALYTSATTPSGGTASAGSPGGAPSTTARSTTSTTAPDG